MRVIKSWEYADKLVELRCDCCSFSVTINGVEIDYSGSRGAMELRFKRETENAAN